MEPMRQSLQSKEQSMSWFVAYIGVAALVAISIFLAVN
jgi:hypothetical protein